MESARWLAVSPLLVAAAAGALGAGHVGSSPVAEWAWEPPPCPEEVARAPGLATWYRLDPVLDRTGTLEGRMLTVGLDGDAGRSLELAPESFASGPVNGLVLAGEDDGSASHLRLLDVERGCASAVADASDVIRSAVLAADGRTLYEHRVDRDTREDLGVWRRTLGGSAERVLDGLGPDRHLGPTFVTTLVLSADEQLAVSSCAPAGCRIRVLHPASGTVTLVRDVGTGLGTVGDALIARAACAGLPCPVVSVSLASGRRTMLVAGAFAAAVGGLAGDRLVIETARDRVAVVELGGTVMDVPGEAGLPLARGSTATEGAEGREGTVPLVPRDRQAGAIHLLDPDSALPPHNGAAR